MNIKRKLHIAVSFKQGSLYLFGVFFELLGTPGEYRNGHMELFVCLVPPFRYIHNKCGQVVQSMFWLQEEQEGFQKRSCLYPNY